MMPSITVIRLGPLMVALVLVTSLVDMFLVGTGAFTFTTLHGDPVSLYGHGLYRFDTLLIGSGFQGLNAVMLLLGVPLRLVALRWYWAGSWRGAVLLAGTLVYTLYLYASVVFGAAYNAFFPFSIVLFAASLFGLMALLTSLDVGVLAARMTGTVPRRAAAPFLFVVGAVLLVVWGGLSPLPALLAGRVPGGMAGYTTSVTHTLDLMSTLLGLTIAGATVAPALARYPYLAAQLVTLVAPFAVLSVAGPALTLAWFRHLPEHDGVT